MKKFLILMVAVLTSAFSHAQNCNYIQFIKGASYEMECFDGKDKKTGTIKSTVKEVKVDGAKKESTIHAENYNKKNEKETEGDLKFVCDNGKLLIDISSMLSGNPLANNPDMELKAETQALEVPANLTVGQTLPDGKATFKMIDKKSGDEFATMTVAITNRKVEVKEKITTAAGTFECHKISYDINVETKLAIGMKMPGSSSKGVDFIAMDLGLVVKTQSLNKNGELAAYQVLTKYTKP